jgi:hypothetical protein
MPCRDRLETAQLLPAITPVNLLFPDNSLKPVVAGSCFFQRLKA